MGVLMNVLNAFMITLLIFIAIIILILILPVFYDISFKSDCETTTLLGKLDILFGIISIRVINNNKYIVIFGTIKINLNDSKNYYYEDEEQSNNENEKYASKSKIRCLKITVYKIESKIKESAYKFNKIVKGTMEYKFKIDLIKKTIEYVQRIIKIIKPKKSDVNVTFGTGNAALNGKLMGAFSMLSIRYPNLYIKSDFEKKILLLDIDAQGNMTLIRLIILCVRYLYEKPIRELRRMNKKGGYYGKKSRRCN